MEEEKNYKKQDAFAFRDFDPEKIFQRPRFKSFHFRDATDAEILSTFDLKNFPDAASMEARLSELEKVKDGLEKMTALILRHTRRHEKLSPQAADAVFRSLVAVNLIDDPIDKKKNRVWKTNQAYLAALSCIAKLQSRINQTLRDGEKILQSKCREEFAANLKRTRIARRMTQRELAERIGIAAPSLSQYEHAQIEPTLKNLVRLANVLNISVDALLGRS